MIINIALKEFHANLLTARFTIGFLLCLLLVPFTLFVSINDYSGQASVYEQNKDWSENSYDVRVYSALNPVIIKPIAPLSIFSRGVSYNVGNGVNIKLDEKPMLAWGKPNLRDNPLLTVFSSLDFCLILATVISLLALLFTYDSCSGEREQGTLKLVLTHSVSRACILLGKVIGASLTLLPILAFCYILCAVVISLSPQVSLSISEWIRVGLLFLASIILFLLFTFLGLFISSRLRSSAASIMVCLFVWVFFVFIIPNLSAYTARNFIKSPSQENRRVEMDALIMKCQNEYQEYSKTLEQPEGINFPNLYSYLGTCRWSMNGPKECAGTPASVMEYFRQLNELAEPVRIDYSDKMWVVQKAFLDGLHRQRKLAETLSLFSPTELFRLVASRLCQTDVDTHQRFMNRTRVYRDEFISYFKDKRLFSSYEYFTRQDPATFMTADEIVRTRSAGEFSTLDEFRQWSEEHNGSLSPLDKVKIPGTAFEDYSSLDLADMPRFHLNKSSIVQDVKRSLFEIAAIVFVGIILFYLSFISFIRYDVR